MANIVSAIIVTKYTCTIHQEKSCIMKSITLFQHESQIHSIWNKKHIILRLIDFTTKYCCISIINCYIFWIINIKVKNNPQLVILQSFFIQLLYFRRIAWILALIFISLGSNNHISNLNTSQITAKNQDWKKVQIKLKLVDRSYSNSSFARVLSCCDAHTSHTNLENFWQWHSVVHLFTLYLYVPDKLCMSSFSDVPEKRKRNIVADKLT